KPLLGKIAGPCTSLPRSPISSVALPWRSWHVQFLCNHAGKTWGWRGWLLAEDWPRISLLQLRKAVSRMIRILEPPRLQIRVRRFDSASGLQRADAALSLAGSDPR